MYPKLPFIQFSKILTCLICIQDLEGCPSHDELLYSTNLGLGMWCKEFGKPLQYSCLENPMDRVAWRATVHRLQRVEHDWSNWAKHSTASPDLQPQIHRKSLIILWSERCCPPKTLTWNSSYAYVFLCLWHTHQKLKRKSCLWW